MSLKTHLRVSEGRDFIEVRGKDVKTAKGAKTDDLGVILNPQKKSYYTKMTCTQ